MDKVAPSFESLIPKLISLCEEGGKRILEFYKKGETLEIIKKGDGSPVTEADHQSHHLLTQGLKTLTPDIPIISEEDEASWEIKSPLYWLIDPLDGTKGFIHHDGQFCISVALMEEHKPILGFLHIPLTRETFCGYKNEAWKYIEGEILPIHTRNRPSEGSTLLLSTHDLKNKEKWEPRLKGTRIAKVEPLHSAIKFCRVAEGTADIYFRFAPCKEWDTAAGQILVEAAGGLMTTLDGSPFLYGKHDLKNEGFQVLGQKL